MDVRTFNSAYQQATPEQLQLAEGALHSILSRSATEPAYRQRLLDDPRSAVAEVTGGAAASAATIRFVEAGGRPTIVLPDLVESEVELDELQLDAVSGGTAWSCALTVYTVLKLIDYIEDDDGQPCTR
jgi:hypothetical protein